MFPTLEYFFKKLLGAEIILPLPTFGFFVAISFLSAAYVLSQELKRKEHEGLLKPVKKKILAGKPFPLDHYLSQMSIGFLLGWKIVGLFTHYALFAKSPQEYIFSLSGNWITGLLGMGISYYYTHKEDVKQRLSQPQWKEITIHPYQEVSNITAIAAVAGILGAKIFHNLEEWDSFIEDPLGALLSFSGLSIYGGLIIGSAAVLYYARKKGITILHLLDAASPALMLAYAIGRMGCHLSGDGDWGIVNTLPKPSLIPQWLWSENYPNNVIQEGIPIEGCVGPYCYVLPHGVFPTPVYESIISLIFFALLLFLRKRFRTGQLFAIYLLLNGTERFFIEKIRINPPYHFFGIEATQAEIISVLFIMGGIILFFRLRTSSEMSS